MSSAVKTPTTPGIAAALVVSMPLIMACAWSLNRIAAWSMSGSVMSPTYSASPRTRAGPSLVEIDAPMPSSRRGRGAPGRTVGAAPAARIAAAAAWTAWTAFW